MLKLYVYGSLKHGFWNHDRYCKGAVTVREGEVLGRLFRLASGIPALEVPGNLVLAEGTRDPRGDALLQRTLSRNLAECPLADPDGPQDMPEYGWGTVKGEILYFHDPILRLPSIDHLEGYRPGGRSHYRRLLYPAFSEDGLEPVWLYACGEEATEAAREPLRSGRWPS